MLSIIDLTYRIEGRPLFEAASAAIADGWKVGFVGRNGAGKTTLLRLIRGELQPDAGEIRMPKGRRIGGVAQEAPASENPLIDIVLSADNERAALLAEADSATDPARIAEIHARLADIAAHSAEARAASILAGLGFDASAQARPAREFSGGWRMRVALAAVLFSAPDLLLLDEPTNYLDLEGAIWLEAFLRRYPYTAIIVSHDRDFLNRASTHILALEQRRLTLSAGDFDLYERKRSEARAQTLAFKSRQDAERRRIQAFIDRFRAKASKARQAQSRIKALEKMETVSVPPEERVAPFAFRNPAPAAPPIVQLRDVDVAYGDAPPVLSRINLRIDDDDRIAILGPNGEGKSTLVKAIAGRLAPRRGDIIRARKIEIAYFAQHQLDELEPQATPLDHVRALRPDAGEAEARAIAAAFGFGAETAETPVARLSGGEKSRLLLGLITHRGPHLIILDEPTNHLDMDSRAALAAAINEFAGAVILITHDARLAEATADRLWLARGGRVAPYEGDLDDYRALVLGAELRETSDKRPTAASDPRKAVRRSAAALREMTAPLRREAEALERRLEELNEILPKIDLALAAPGLYETNLARATKLQKERAALIEAIAATEQKWLEALESLETAERDAQS